MYPIEIIKYRTRRFDLCYDGRMNDTNKDLEVIRSQQLPNGLSLAGDGPNYQHVWIRDNVYVALAMQEAGQHKAAARVYEALCGIVAKYHTLLERKAYPTQAENILPPRFTTDGARVEGEWSNKQHDAVGVLLFGLGRLYQTDPSLLSDAMKKLCQQLVNYLEACQYFRDADNGMWEEEATLHASSLAACIKGIENVAAFCEHDEHMLASAKENLENLLPRESVLHEVDLAQLSLVWPYGYLNADIVKAVEHTLLREHGVIRYVGDHYEAKDGEEPQWVMGLPWLGIAHFALGNTDKARHYLHQTESLYTENGLPESYLASNKQCAHTPLAWSHAMALVLRSKLAQKQQ
jgi:GH15 family glucan-1,4-alpha-glucosidase